MNYPLNAIRVFPVSIQSKGGFKHIAAGCSAAEKRRCSPARRRDFTG
jgi:hypothetical protein